MSNPSSFHNSNQSASSGPSVQTKNSMETKTNGVSNGHDDSESKRMKVNDNKGVISSLTSTLKDREERGMLRSLRVDMTGSDLCSNDYIGFARDKVLFTRIEREYSRITALLLDEGCDNDNKTLFSNSSAGLGSTGSRLLTGNSKYAESVEKYIAEFHNQEAALIFNSGFDANLGLLGSIPQENDVVVFDELVHNSMREGLRLARGKHMEFKHNDVNHLREVLSSIYPLSNNGNIVSSHIYCILNPHSHIHASLEILIMFWNNIDDCY